jgi:murein DD-endopeptidase MepM/ murein hydrolase activator NlpD
MRFWPVPDSYDKTLPLHGAEGSFWEDRGDRHHCGVDIYAPEGSNVLSIDDGQVMEVGVFTSPDRIPYWNVTYYLFVRHGDGLIVRYAELGDVRVEQKQAVKAGQLIGHIGTVINAKKIQASSPGYIQRLKLNGRASMLHLELYRNLPGAGEDYLGGNVFTGTKPGSLLDPTGYLKALLSSDQ